MLLRAVAVGGVARCRAGGRAAPVGTLAARENLSSGSLADFSLRVSALPDCFAHQRLRADRSFDASRLRRWRKRAGCDASCRSAGPSSNTRVYVSGWRSRACPGGRCWRALHCGRRPGARLSGAARADRRAVCGGPVRARGQPHVPDRRSGALAPRRGAGLHRARGPADQAARLPHRARRDRGGAGAASVGGAGGRDRTRPMVLAASGWSLMWLRPPIRPSIRPSFVRISAAASPTTWCRRHSWFSTACR